MNTLGTTRQQAWTQGGGGGRFETGYPRAAGPAPGAAWRGALAQEAAGQAWAT